jgi:hypothetical protein
MGEVEPPSKIFNAERKPLQLLRPREGSLS